MKKRMAAVCFNDKFVCFIVYRFCISAWPLSRMCLRSGKQLLRPLR